MGKKNKKKIDTIEKTTCNENKNTDKETEESKANLVIIKERIAEKMHQDLKSELDYEVGRVRNFENKTYFAFVVITFLIGIPLTIVKDISLIDILIENEANNSNIIFTYSMLLLSAIFYILIFISLNYFFKVLESRNVERISLNQYSLKALKLHKNYLNYIAEINNSLKICLETYLKAHNITVRNFNIGIRYLKHAIFILFILIITLLIGGEM